MNATTIGIDLAKSVFHVHGIDATGAVVIKKKLRRAQVLSFFEALPACLVVWKPARRRTIGRGRSRHSDMMFG